ncbi:MAG: hypothetical protein J5879_08725, partial [Clostridia bacterium]|nr:hypothetical protein [Clostridia bacterium]
KAQRSIKIKHSRGSGAQIFSGTASGRSWGGGTPKKAKYARDQTVGSVCTDRPARQTKRNTKKG